MSGEEKTMRIQELYEVKAKNWERLKVILATKDKFAEAWRKMHPEVSRGRIWEPEYRALEEEEKNIAFEDMRINIELKGLGEKPMTAEEYIALREKS